MEEVDRHILESCRQLQCSFFDEDSDVGFDSLSTENCFEIVVRSLWQVDPTSKSGLPTHLLPPNIRDRFRAATVASEYLKKIGVRGDYGYQTLLYGSVRDLRNIFIGLIEKLPKDSVVEETELSNSCLLLQSAARGLPSSSHPRWVPEFCRRLRLRHDGRYWCPGEGDTDFFSFLKSRGDLWSGISNEEENRALIASLIRREEECFDSNEKGKAPKPAPPEKPRVRPAIAPKPKNLQGEDQEKTDGNDEIATKTEQLRAKLQEIREQNDVKRYKIVQAHYETEKLAETLRVSGDVQEDRLLQLLENPVDGKQKILDYLKAGVDRKNVLENQWEATRSEQIEILTSLREEAGQRTKIVQLRDSIEKCQNTILELQAGREMNDAMIPKLERQLERRGDDNINREVITTRIMEMILSLKKQQEELAKILSANASIRKEMKWESQTLYRTFNIIDDALFKAADCYKGEQAYRLFGRTNAKCNEAMALIEENGATIRQIEQLTDQIEREKQDEFSCQLERVLADIQNVEEENSKLEEKLNQNRD